MSIQPDTILVVDDEQDNFEIIEILLYQQCYHLNYAADGAEALNLIEHLKPDVILLDVIMPELNGIEVCKLIKSNPNWHQIPIIMVTALNSKKDLACCLEAGADDFLSKPINAIELRARIASMLRIKKQYDALEAAMKSLESTLELREDMSYTIVHDMRNPIANILLASDLLLRTELEEKQRLKMEAILNSGQRLLGLTDDLLMMAKMESGTMTLNRVEVDIGKMARKAVSDFSDLARQKNIQIANKSHGDKICILADHNLLRRVFDNLLSNAIKFSRSRSKIYVEVESIVGEKRMAIIRIADNGPGINEEMRLRIFEKYEVGNLMTGVSQIGLGLAFCKMAIEAHGGTIFVESNQPTGSVFVVKIEMLDFAYSNPI